MGQRSQPGGGRELLSWQLWIIALGFVGAAYLLFAERKVAGVWGYSLDDSWIYAVYARNLATGQGYSFNPGEHVAAATGPLYVFLLAGLYVLARDVVLPAKLLGVEDRALGMAVQAGGELTQEVDVAVPVQRPEVGALTTLERERERLEVQDRAGVAARHRLRRALVPLRAPRVPVDVPVDLGAERRGQDV